MIRDKNIFECIIIEDVIHFPDYMIWTPKSHGLQRRSHLFQQVFPEMRTTILEKNAWMSLCKKHWPKRRIFSCDPQGAILTEIRPEEFFTNAYGYPVYVGERIQLSEGTYTITKLQVIRYAGLIASYVAEEGVTKKVNIGNMAWNEDLNCWTF